MKFKMEVKSNGSGSPVVWKDSYLILSLTGTRTQVEALKEAIEHTIIQIGSRHET